MMQMKLNDYNVKRAIAGNPLLAGKKPIGRGAFSMVFDGPKPSSVLKLTIDRAGYYLLNCWVAGAKGKHFPRVRKNHKDIGVTTVKGEDYPIYLFEMERLLPNRRGTPARKEADAIQESSYHRGGRTTGDCIGAIANDKSAAISRSVRNALQDLEVFAGNYDNLEIDMHSGNFMQRKDGTLVITDPFADKRLFDIQTGSGDFGWRQRCG